MRALILDTYQNGRFREADIESRSPGRGELRIRVHASGVNPVDGLIRTGLAPYAMPKLPAVLGTDAAGIVTDVGPGVEGFAVGDEVYGLAGGVRGLPGSLAEFMTVDAALMAKKPVNLTMREAAALPLVALTAWFRAVPEVWVMSWSSWPRRSAPTSTQRPRPISRISSAGSAQRRSTTRA